MGHGIVKVNRNPHSVFVSLYVDLACVAVNPSLFLDPLANFYSKHHRPATVKPFHPDPRPQIMRHAANTFISRAIMPFTQSSTLSPTTRLYRALCIRLRFSGVIVNALLI